MATRNPSGARERGQASVELLALLPLIALLVLMAWQAAIAGHALWMAAVAAREAARAQALGHDPAAAARRVLPRSLARGALVRRDGDGVRVRIVVPAVAAPLHLGTLTARARMEPQA